MKFIVSIGVMLASAGFAGAAPLVVSASLTGTGGQALSAKASFTVVGSQLDIILTDTQTSSTSFLANLLSGIFWNMNVSNVTLTPVSAAASLLIDANNNPVPGTNVSGDWAFSSNANFNGFKFGVGGAGFGVFGPSNLFTPCSACGQPDGADYLLSGAAGVTSGSDGIPSSGPYIKNQVTLVFDLSGAGAGTFNPATNITSTLFTWGTLPEFSTGGGGSTQATPEPVSIILTGGGLTCLALVMRKRTQKIR